MVIGIISVFARLGIPGELYLVLGYLIIIDFITGVLKSYINETTNSRCAIRGFIVKAILLVIPISFALMGKLVDIDTTFIISLIMGALGGANILSILGNIYNITTGKELEEYDVVSLLIKKLSGIIVDILDKTLSSKK